MACIGDTHGAETLACADGPYNLYLYVPTYQYYIIYNSRGAQGV